MTARVRPGWRRAPKPSRPLRPFARCPASSSSGSRSSARSRSWSRGAARATSSIFRSPRTSMRTASSTPASCPHGYRPSLHRARAAPRAIAEASATSGCYAWSSSCCAMVGCWRTRSRRGRTTAGTTPSMPASLPSSNSRPASSAACRWVRRICIALRPWSTCWGSYGPTATRGGSMCSRHPGAKLHLYGKAEARPGRKMGHFTVLGPDVDGALATARAIRSHLNF